MQDVWYVTSEWAKTHRLRTAAHDQVLRARGPEALAGLSALHSFPAQRQLSLFRDTSFSPTISRNVSLPGSGHMKE